MSAVRLQDGVGYLQRWPASSTSAELASADRTRTILNPCDLSFCNNERASLSTAPLGLSAEPEGTAAARPME
jgi:hypothetical protein